MRILLALYVGVMLLLNFLIEEDLIFFLAMTTFPVSLYLLLKNPKSKPKKPKQPLHTITTASLSKQKEDSL